MSMRRPPATMPMASPKNMRARPLERQHPLSMRDTSDAAFVRSTSGMRSSSSSHHSKKGGPTAGDTSAGAAASGKLRQGRVQIPVPPIRQVADYEMRAPTDFAQPAHHIKFLAATGAGGATRMDYYNLDKEDEQWVRDYNIRTLAAWASERDKAVVDAKKLAAAAQRAQLEAEAVDNPGPAVANASRAAHDAKLAENKLRAIVECGHVPLENDEMEALIDLFEKEAGMRTTAQDPSRDFPITLALALARTMLQNRAKAAASSANTLRQRGFTAVRQSPESAWNMSADSSANTRAARESEAASRATAGKGQAVEAVYTYWKMKRKRRRKALLHVFRQPPTTSGPYAAFMERASEHRRVSVRHTKKNDMEVWEKVCMLRIDFERVAMLLEHIHMRELMKREQVVIDCHAFDQQLRFTPFAAQFAADHNSFLYKRKRHAQDVQAWTNTWSEQVRLREQDPTTAAAGGGLIIPRKPVSVALTAGEKIARLLSTDVPSVEYGSSRSRFTKAFQRRKLKSLHRELSRTRQRELARTRQLAEGGPHRGSSSLPDEEEDDASDFDEAYCDEVERYLREEAQQSSAQLRAGALLRGTSGTTSSTVVPASGFAASMLPDASHAAAGAGATTAVAMDVDFGGSTASANHLSRADEKEAGIGLMAGLEDGCGSDQDMMDDDDEWEECPHFRGRIGRGQRMLIDVIRLRCPKVTSFADMLILKSRGADAEQIISDQQSVST